MTRTVMYSFSSTETSLKSIQSYYLDEKQIAEDLYNFLTLGIDKTSGTKIKKLNGEKFLNAYRLRTGSEEKFRLIYEQKVIKNVTKIIFVIFGKKDDDFYRKSEIKYSNYLDNKDDSRIVPIKNYNFQTNIKFKNFIEEGFNYSIDFSDEQNEILDFLNDPKQIISYVKGIPGSGKTVIGAEFSKEIFKNGTNNTVIIVLPNPHLITTYKKYYKYNDIDDNDVRVVENIEQFQNNSINIFTLNNFRSLILGNDKQEFFSNENYLKECIKHTIKTKSMDVNETLQFINAFFNDDGEIIYYPKKDALNEVYSDKIDHIKPYVKKILNNIKSNNRYTRKMYANQMIESLKIKKKSGLLSKLMNDKNLYFIVDEVQDLLLSEIIYFSHFCFIYHKRKPFGSKVIYLGDEKQRIAITAFTWSIMKTKLLNLINKNIPEFNKIEIEYKLNENFRVTKQVADFIDLIEKNTKAGKYRNVELITRDKCKYTKESVNIIKSDINAVISAVKNLKQETLLSDISKLIIISENDDVHRKLKTQNDFLSLDLIGCKGTEWDNVFLLNPFESYIDKSCWMNKKFSPDQNYKLYTLSTRSKNALTIILAPHEFKWFKKIYEEHPYESIVLVDKPPKEQQQIIENIIKNVGFEKLTPEKQIMLFQNRIENLIINHNKIDELFFKKLNKEIISNIKYLQSLDQIILILKDHGIGESENDFGIISSLIENYSGLDRIYLDIFWYAFNNEFFKVREIIYSNIDNLDHALELSIEYEGKIKNESNPFPKILFHYLNKKETNETLEFNNSIDKELWKLYSKEKDYISENHIFIKFLLQKLKTLAMLLK